MAEFYNAETLLEFVKQNTPHIDGETTIKCVERAIKEAPTADVVEMVRCKDCEHWNKTDTDIIVNIDYGKCTNSNSPYHNEEETTGGDYCSYGERKCDNDGEV